MDLQAQLAYVDNQILYNVAMTKDEKAKEIIRRLRKIYNKPRTALDFNNPFELVVATILSAQTTDKLVNTITPILFKKYPTIDSFAKADLTELDNEIKRVNFHFNKAKNIKAAAEMVVKTYGGKVPDNMEELDALPGVARKTANVVLCNVFNKNEGVVVDTHVMRLATKLGLTDKKDPVKIEQDLMQAVPKDDWCDFSSMLILYGREYAPARGQKAGVVDILSDLYI
jgi:endonuclease-3